MYPWRHKAIEWRNNRVEGRVPTASGKTRFLKDN